MRYLHTLVSEYASNRPGDAYTLLSQYEGEGLPTEPTAQKPKKPSVSAQIQKAKKLQPSSQQTVPPSTQHKSQAASSSTERKLLMDNALAEGVRMVGREAKALNYYLKTHHQEIYTSTQAAFEKIGQIRDKGIEILLDSAQAWDNLLFNGKVSQSLAEPIRYGTAYIEHKLDQHTDQEFRDGAAVFFGMFEVAGVGTVATSISKATIKQISQVSQSAKQQVGRIFFKSSSIDDIARQWKNPDIKANQFEIRIHGTKFKADPEMKPDGVPVFVGVSDKLVKDYAYELMKPLGAKEFPKVAYKNGHQYYIYKNPETGISITLRTESKSAASTEAKWTIDINKHPSFPGDKNAEIKFRGS